MFKKSILLACFINAALSLEKIMIESIENRQITHKTGEILKAGEEFDLLSTKDMIENLKGIKGTFIDNLTALERLYPAFGQSDHQPRVNTLLRKCNRIKNFLETGIDISCILDSIKCGIPDALHEFHEAFKPDEAFVEMLKEFDHQKISVFDLSTLPKNITADQLRKLDECRSFIRLKHPHLLGKMDVICALCQPIYSRL